MFFTIATDVSSVMSANEKVALTPTSLTDTDEAVAGQQGSWHSSSLFTPELWYPQFYVVIQLSWKRAMDGKKAYILITWNKYSNSIWSILSKES